MLSILAMLPVQGFLACFFIWINLPAPVKIMGGICLMIDFKAV